MSLRGLIFEDLQTVVRSDPARADIALFVGLVARRKDAFGFVPAPQTVSNWLAEMAWRSVDPPDPNIDPALLHGRPLYVLPEDDELLNVPVPIDTWDVFDRLFAWDARPSVEGADVSYWTYLGTALRSFFRQGGRKCYVVVAGQPWQVGANRSDRMANMARLVPGARASSRPDATDRSTWRGIAHLWGLEDVSLVCLPDLPDLVADDLPPSQPLPLTPGPLEQFVECASHDVAVTQVAQTQTTNAPCGAGGSYADWLDALNTVARFLSISLSSSGVQFIGAIPLPVAGTLADADPLAFFADPLSRDPKKGARGNPLPGIASNFVQLAYPWITSGSLILPGGVEPPDGVLAGVIARTALTRGAFRSAANSPLVGISDFRPQLSRDQTDRIHADLASATPLTSDLTFIERISILGPTPQGMRLLSDVTTSFDPLFRPAAVSRLVGIILRSARQMGESLIFEPSGEHTWDQLEKQLRSFFRNLLEAGALRGSPATAFSVRCDRSTMTQADIDAGRLIAVITFDPAAPIDRITVVLAMSEGGEVSLVSSDQRGAKV